MIVTVCVLVVFLAIAAASLKHPGAALSLVLCMFAFDQLLNANSTFFAGNQALLNFAVGLVCVAAWLLAFVNGNYRFRGWFHPVAVCTFLFLAYALFGTQWSINPRAFDTLRAQAPYLVLQVLVAPLLVGRSTDAKTALQLSALVTAAVAFYVAVDSSIWWSSQRLALTVAGDPRAVSNPLSLGDIGATAFILSVLMPGFDRWFEPRTWLRYAVCATALLVTARASRGETVAALLAALVFFLAMGGRKRLFSKSVAVVVMSLIAGAVLVSVLQSEIGARYDQNVVSHDLSLRIDFAQVVLDRFWSSSEAWAFGLGTNGSEALLGGNIPHNHMVQALADHGFVGLLLWLAIPTLALVACWRTLNHPHINPQQRFAAAALGAFLLYNFVVGLKRAGPIEANLLMYALLTERLLLALRAELRERQQDTVPSAEFA